MAALCSLACSRAQLAQPQPTGITPAAALTPQDVTITIHGSGFSVLASRQLGQGIHVEGAFQAWLGTTPLSNVTWIDDGTLQAVVPAGTFGMPLDLTVTGPSGSATLSSAFRAAVTGTILRAVPQALPASISIGQAFSVAVDVYNDGDVDALALQIAAPASPNAAANGPAAGPQDIPAGQVRTFTWPMIGTASGSLDLTSTGSATDALLGGAVPLTVAWNPSVVQRPPVLVVTSFTLRSSSNSSTIDSGQPFTATLVISNTGEATAARVTPALPVVAPTGGAAATAFTTPRSRSIAGGRSAAFTWSYVENGTAPGTLTLNTSASGTDANSGATVTLASASSDTLTVQSPPLLSAAIAAPASVVTGQSFTVTFTVTNGGQASVTGFTPASFVITGAAVSSTGPTPTSTTLPGGGNTVFSWSCVASGSGGITVSASAAGVDANDGSTQAVSATTSSVVPEILQLASDPFGDGTPFTQVFDFNGRVYLGPSKTGNGAVRMLPDGSAPQSVSFAISQDSGTLRNSNSSPAPYPSFGYTGCAANTSQCGPDNEDGRGLFASGTILGTPWLIAGGSRSGNNLVHVYMSSDTSTAPPFSYVGLSKVLSNLDGLSALAILDGRIYAGFSSSKSNRPYLAVINRVPTAPGYDASAIDVVDLEASRMPALGSNPSGNNKNLAPSQSIDAISAFNDLLYLGNNGAWMRSTNNNPGDYGSSPSDWALATPSDAAYAAKVSVTTTKLSDFTPADRALVGMAAFAGKLYAARNTTTGPQLWACTPSAAGTCDPANWSLLAPNTAGDAQLSQFNDPTNTVVSLLAATSSHLYVGYDNGSGVRLYESNVAAPAAVSDFSGQAGCLATSSACPGLGGNGLGAGVTHIFDARTLTYNGWDFLYLTAGTGSAGVAVFRTGG